MLNELDNIRIAIEDLVHGQLSPVLLPHQIIAYTLWSLHHDLRQNSSLHTCTVLGHTTADYYCTHSFVAAQQGSKLTIGLNFPMSSVPTSLTLYQIVFSVSVPGDQNVAHVTEIDNLPYGIAFSCTTHLRIPYLSLQTRSEKRLLSLWSSTITTLTLILHTPHLH